ncbi:uncharacterized protein LOC129723764 [Wyeomyia smithii]|uniref:uncharacterized protein LOC129723764 n=1 Tax=Wyeomyia smithii TaxID=174621 RepID=UPI002467DB7A|nr:uncharacterized protein LOC129723764 [Wyeomyia smithii]
MESCKHNIHSCRSVRFTSVRTKKADEMESNIKRERIPWKNYEKLFTFKKRKSEKNFEVTCSVCLPDVTILSCGYSSATNMKTHLLRKHKWSEEKVRNELGVECKKSRLTYNDITQQDVHEATDNLIMAEGLPFKIVDSVYFKAVAELGLPEGLSVGSRQSLANRMDIKFSAMMTNLKAHLASAKNVSTTADCWTKFRRSYLAMTVHWLDDKTMERKSAALALRRITGRHTADTLAMAIYNVHNEFDIVYKARKCTTDGAANLRKALSEHSLSANNDFIDDSDVDDHEDAESSVTVLDVNTLLDEGAIFKPLPAHQRCACHILNLVATTDVSAVFKESNELNKMNETVQKKLKTWWMQQSESSVVADVIKECLGVCLITPVKSDWISEYDAISLISNIVDNTPKKLNTILERTGLPKLLPSEVVYLKEFVWVMQPIVYTLNILQRDKFMYMGYLLPTIYGLLRSLDGKCSKDGEPLKYCLPLLDAVISSLKSDKRFGVMLRDEELIVSASLIPAFMFEWDAFKNINRDDIYRVIIKRMKAFDRCESYLKKAMENDCSDLDEEAAFFGVSQSKFQTMRMETCQKELNRYLACGLHTIEECYGSRNPVQFHRLKNLFMRYNTAIPASASVERLCSLVGSVFDQTRSQLSDARLEQQALMRANMDLISLPTRQ